MFNAPELSNAPLEVSNAPLDVSNAPLEASNGPSGTRYTGSMPDLDVRWIHGAPDCAFSTDPPLQVYAFDKDTYILRQSKCLHFEAPFLYLLFGTGKALLLDTGAGTSPGRGPLPVRNVVQGIIDQWQAMHQRPDLELVVAHTHGHDDHVAGDDQFRDQPHTTLVPPGVA